MDALEAEVGVCAGGKALFDPMFRKSEDEDSEVGSRRASGKSG